MIPLATPNLSGNEARYLQQCIETGYVSSIGPFVDRFEKSVADSAGNLYGVATSAGTTGLHAALTAVGVGRDDLVLLPSFTFIASANAIAHCGAQPWLFDIDGGWGLNPELVEQELKDKCHLTSHGVIYRPTGQRVAAMLPVHTLGLPADMPRLITIARTHDIPVVADAACALGATMHGKPVGALGADLNVFSFNGNKTVTAGGGGVVTGDNSELVDRVRHLTTTARVSESYDHDLVGFNYRMTNLQAAVGVAQMENLERFVAAKRRISATYRSALEDIPTLSFFPDRQGCVSACWFSGVRLLAPNADIDIIINELREKGIGARPFWKPMHLQAPYRAAPTTDMPSTDSLWHRILTLPCSSQLSAADQQCVTDAVRYALDRNL